MQPNLRQMLTAEFFGTFALVFAGTGAIVVNDVAQGAITHVGIALTFGLIVLAMIYAVGEISGCHLNPAVTLGFWASGRFSGRLVGPYVAVQFLGAAAASLVLKLLFSEHPNLGATLPMAGNYWQAFVFELLLTLILMVVILGVSTGSKEKGLLAGVAVGAVIGLEAMFAGPICGASMNPARSFGPALCSANWQYLWVYLVAPVLGAWSGVVIHRLISSDR